jgi:ketosteroid isomerase-like protein
MRLRLIPVSLVLVTATATASPVNAQAARDSSARAAPLPSVTLPAELDRVLRDYERAWRAGDAVMLSTLFAEDGFVLQAGRAPVRGRASIQSAYGGQAGGPLRLRALAYATADTVGYIIGAYGYGDAPGDQGKFTLVLRRARNGPWQIFSDMDNQSQMPRRSPSPSGGP